MKKRVLATLLSLTMAAAALTACGGSSAPAASEAPKDESKATGEDDAGDAAAAETGEENVTAAEGDVLRLQILDMPANESGVITGWFNDYIKEQVGVELEFLPTGDQGEQKLQALMASGELPDLVVFKDDKQVINAVTGDMLLAYDDYKELVPNLYKNAATSLQYYADNMSNGQGKAYAVGVELKNAVEESGDTGGISIRYDYYKELGSPEVKTMEDWLPIIKQMQDAHPTNEDGQKAYGISLFKDWDRSYMTLGMFFAPLVGVNIQGEGNLAQVDYTNNEEVSSILDEDSAYMRFLRFMFEANQMGLVDPDSMTQRFNDYTQKVTDGRVHWAVGDWGTSFTTEQQNEGIGFRRLAGTEDKILLSPKQIVGKGWSVSVSKASKHPEEAMKVVNLLFDYETAMVEQNGPKGICWDVDENGNPYVTEEGYQWYTDSEKMGKGKGNNVFRAFTAESVNEDMGCVMNNSYWDKPDYAPADTKLVQEWKEDFGIGDMLQLQYQRGNVIVRPFVPNPTFTDEMEQISARVGDVIKTNSWKMVFAKDQAEFDALYKEMVEKAEGMGINEFVDWYRAEYEKMAEFGEKYAN